MNQPRSPEQLILIRHTPVSDDYRGLCYGSSDVPLRPDAHEAHDRIANQLADLKPHLIIHSDLERTRQLAERLAQKWGCKIAAAPEIQERDFGQWELQSWDSLYHQYADDMMRMLTDPNSFRPGGGETTFELRDRVLRWHESLSLDGPTIVVAHGGPIAALLGSLQGLPVEDWVSLIPNCGEWVAIHERKRNLV
jgi:broad specificity phosphatase PhoE